MQVEIKLVGGVPHGVKREKELDPFLFLLLRNIMIGRDIRTILNAA
jgi:hypothetical protein